MNVDTSPPMTSWAQAAHYDVALGSCAHDGRSVLYNHGGELRIFVGFRPDGWIAVTESERLGAEHLAFAATSMAVIERWLLGYLGSSIRAERKLPRLQRRRELGELAPGYGISTVSFDGRTRACLIGPDGGLVALSVVGAPVATSELVETSIRATVPLATITRALLHETGSPLFTPRPPRRTGTAG